MMRENPQPEDNETPPAAEVKPRLRPVRGVGVTLFLFLAIAGISALPVVILQSTTSVLEAPTGGLAAVILNKMPGTLVLLVTLLIFLFLAFHAALYCERAFGRPNASRPDLTQVKRAVKQIGLPIFLLYLVLTVALTILTETMDVPYLEQHGEEFILWGIVGPFCWWNWMKSNSTAGSKPTEQQDG